LSPIFVIPPKNGKLKICINFKKINAATKKDPYPLPFTNEVLNIIVGYGGYRLGGFYMEGDVVWNEKWTSNILKSCYQNI
jgi:hypothetical protein